MRESLNLTLMFLLGGAFASVGWYVYMFRRLASSQSKLDQVKAVAIQYQQLSLQARKQVVELKQVIDRESGARTALEQEQLKLERMLALMKHADQAATSEPKKPSFFMDTQPMPQEDSGSPQA